MSAEPASTPGGFGVYVHWPFCAAKCPYCDFNSHVRASIDEEAWADALCVALTRAAARIGPRRVDSIFFGGGTPSLMAPATVAAVIDRVAALWHLPGDAEISLEANPTSVEAGRFRGYGVAGVNRVSLGVQALSDPDLRRLGRLHSVDEARAAFELARSAFDRVSFDLIYARQGQGLAAWEAELAMALDMAVDHLSLYQLTIEPGTAFGALHARGRLADLPQDDTAADMYALTQAMTAAAGMPAYEISNHAREGAVCRHNMVYWRSGDFLGIGPGAHGRLTLGGQRLATDAIRAPEAWLQAVRDGQDGLRGEDTVPPEEQAEEYLMMALRLAEGVELERYQGLGGVLPGQDVLDDLVSGGFLDTRGSRIIATEMGRPVLNAVLRALMV
ncbi:radical SAM family heme chaperone HemW [Oceanibium sediminis]|uniref:radical SAM family heme chaperone HemW n=1 Tax=Oceanibium sediminis TaxID=2026339 RepID=UPI000DD37C65|nr:radical SAM family heme chaperone HemW [Oceanibium sediminis]